MDSLQKNPFPFHNKNEGKFISEFAIYNEFLSNVKFPVIAAVRGTFACYHHVIVVWNNVVYDYESKNGYPLTNESLTQVCGQNTTFHGISCGYGIFSPKKIKQLAQNAHIRDWGFTEWQTKNSPVRKSFI